MEKQSSTVNNSYHVPAPALGASTTTTSGVTVFDPSSSSHNNPQPPPTYDQAIGSTITTTTSTTRNVTYTPAGWSGAGVRAQNTGYAMPMPPTTTQYSYATPGPQHLGPTICTQPPFVIIHEQPMLPLGPEPVYLTCPSCHIQKLTRIEHEPNSKTHLIAALLCLLGLWCCVCFPYCAGSCMNTHHYCGNCSKFLGTYGTTL